MPRRKRKQPQRLQKYQYESTSSDQSSLCDKRQCKNKSDNKEVRSNTNSSNYQNNTMSSSNQRNLQYTSPLTSSPNIGYQPFQQFQPFMPLPAPIWQK